MSPATISLFSRARLAFILIALHVALLSLPINAEAADCSGGTEESILKLSMGTDALQFWKKLQNFVKNPDVDDFEQIIKEFQFSDVKKADLPDYYQSKDYSLTRFTARDVRYGAVKDVVYSIKLPNTSQGEPIKSLFIEINPENICIPSDEYHRAVGVGVINLPTDQRVPTLSSKNPAGYLYSETYSIIRNGDAYKIVASYQRSNCLRGIEVTNHNRLN
ncbi:hypothetical protein [Burkholderia cepacia]|uniref:hypothetical protein n=1 Tax=Burkholderia cepacia TaxID=292 RepID=UPI000AC4B190|nr:hypothetical protein [Burkholderia cepacia]